MLRFKTIRTKITFTIFSFFLFFLSIHMIYEFHEVKTREFKALESVNKTVNKLLVEYISAYIYNYDIDNIQLSIDAIDSKYIKFIYILDKDGIILVKNQAEKPTYEKYPKFEKLLEATDNSIKNTNEYIILNTFRIMDIPIGYMIIEANLDNYKSDMEETKNTFILEVFIFSVFLLIIAMFISKSLSLPIENIVKKLQDVKDDERLEIPKQEQEEFQYLSLSISNSHNRLLSSNLKLKTIFDLTTDGIAIIDLKGKFLFVNNAYTKITGYSKEMLLQMTFCKLMAPEFRDELAIIVKDLLVKYSCPDLKMSCIVKDDKKVDAVINMNIMPDKKTIMVVVKDVTKENSYKKQRKEQEQRLIQQSRMAQMGEMISMIAHQWRQPLTSISAISINLRLKMQLEDFDLESKEGIKEYQDYFFKKLEDIEENTQILTTTIDDFRNFYKPNKNSVVITLEEIIAKALGVIKTSLLNDNIEIVYEYNSTDKIRLYASELMQVILNILKNAQDIIKEKEIVNPQIKISTKEKTISICDNAGGIPEDILPKIFDPYFSTKDDKNGTGLGLYMSKTIVEEHHKGNLSANNQENDKGENIGVCFIIELGEIG